jgi:hypothetical protein
MIDLDEPQMKKRPITAATLLAENYQLPIAYCLFFVERRHKFANIIRNVYIWGSKKKITV